MFMLLDFDTIILLLFLVSSILTDQGLLLPVSLLVVQLLQLGLIELKKDSRRRDTAYQFNYSLIKKFFKARIQEQSAGGGASFPFQQALQGPLSVLFSGSQNKGQPKRREGAFALDLWSNLRIGDIIIMKQNQEFPADVLIIDSEYLQPCDKKKSNFVVNENGGSLIQKEILVHYGSNLQDKIRAKTCFKGTYEKNRNEGQTRVNPLLVVHSLSGTLIWEWNKLGYFSGQFRFSNNSGSYDLSNENLVRQGAFLRSNHKLVCLVLNVGTTCQSSMSRKGKTNKVTCANLQKSIRKKLCSGFKKEQENHTIIAWFRLVPLFVFFVFVLIDILKWQRSDLSGFYTEILGQDYRITSEGFSSNQYIFDLLRQFNLCVLFLPLSYNHVVALVTLAQAYFCEWDINLVPANVKFNNFNAMRKLPWISQVITSPSALEGEQTYKVNYFRCGDQYYHNVSRPEEEETSDANYKYETLFTHRARTDSRDLQATGDKLEQDSVESQSNSDEDGHQPPLEYLPHLKPIYDHEFHSTEADDIIKDTESPQRDQMIKFFTCLCLCQQAIIKTKEELLQKQSQNGEQSSGQSFYNSFHPDEEAQLMFASQYNCTFALRWGTILTVFIDGKKERFDELAYLNVKLQQSSSFVTVQLLRPFSHSGNIVINMKGSVNTIIEVTPSVSLNNRQYLVNEADRLSQLGIQVKAFCSKELSKEDSAQLRKKIDQLSLFSKTYKQQLTALVSSYLNNMTLQGTLGFQKVIPLRNTLTVQDMIGNRVKLWLLSQYSQRKTLINCVNLDVYSDKMEKIIVRGANDRELEDSIRSCFNQVFESEQKFQNREYKKPVERESEKKIENRQFKNLPSKLHSGLAKIQRIFTSKQRRNSVAPQSVQQQQAEQQTEQPQLAKNGKSNNTTANNITPGENSKGNKSKKSFQSRPIDQKKINKMIERPQRALHFTSQQLNLLLRDQNQMRIFLSLAMYCDVIIGADISPETKGRLSKEILKFQNQSQDTNKGYVMGVIGSPQDRYLLEKQATDVTICMLAQNNSKNLQIEADITFYHFYALTYMLFKHGSQLHRRLTMCGRFYLRRSLFIIVCGLAFYVQTGASFQLRFDQTILAFLQAFLFQVLAFFATITYETDGFNFLHRVNGQYNCNETFKIISSRKIPAFVLELALDTVIIVHLAGFVDGFYTLSRFSGYTVQEGSTLMFMNNLVLIVHTILLFIKMPVLAYLNFYSMAVGLVITTLLCIFQDPELISQRKIWQTAPVLQLTYCIILFGFKIYGKHLLRYLLKYSYKWDHFNAYVKERLCFEQFESFQQIKHISLDNRRHAYSMVDAHELWYQRILCLIDRNLLQLTYRNELTEMLFEKVGYIRTFKNTINQREFGLTSNSQQGLGTAHHLIMNECRHQIDQKTMNFKFTHQQQDYRKHQILNNKIDKYINSKVFSSICILLALFLTVAGLRIAANWHQVSKSEGAFQYIFWLVNVCACLIAMVFIKYALTTKDLVIFGLSCVVLPCTAVQVHINLTQFDSNEFHFVVASLVAFTILNRKVYLYSTLLLAMSFCIWYTVTQINLLSGSYNKWLAETDHSQRDLQMYLVAAAIPCFTFILILYAYWDEFYRKARFLVLERRIKEYKRLRMGVQKLVPQIIRKSQQKNQQAIQINKQMVLVVIKIQDYQTLISHKKRPEQNIVKTMLQVYNGVDKLVSRHGLMRVQAFEDRFHVVGGIKLIEQQISQKLQSTPAVQRACKFSFDLIDLANQLSKMLKQTLQFQIVIHCPQNVAGGLLGTIKQNLYFVGNAMNKSELILNRTHPNQICISKECYESLAASHIHHLIKVKETVKMENQYLTENIYELLDRKKHQPHNRTHGQEPNQARALRKQKTLGAKPDEKNLLTPSPNQNDLDSSGNSKSSLGYNNSFPDPSEISGQRLQSESQIDNQNSQFVMADYQALFQSIKEFKDDQEIAQNPVLNQQYKFVNRPSSLLRFNNQGPSKAGEQKFVWQMNFEYRRQNVIFSLCLVTLAFALMSILSHQLLPSAVSVLFQLLWLVPFALYAFLSHIQYLRLPESTMVLLRIGYFTTAALMTLLLVACVIKEGLQPLSITAFGFFVIVALGLMFTQRGILYRDYFVVSLLMVAVWLVISVLQYDSVSYTSISCQAVGLLACEGLFLIAYNEREMQRRIEFNRHVMLSVESKKNKEVAAQIMPIQALTALQQEESFVHTIKNGTLLIFQMPGFREFMSTREVDKRPKIAFEFLAQVYSKFDDLVEKYGLFKVDADSLHYIVMSDPSAMMQHNASYSMQVTQAVKLCQLGCDMVKVVQECTTQSVAHADVGTLQYLKRIGAQIILHTGNIITCITGNKLLEYKIFGKVPQICMYVLKLAPKDSVCVTKTTKQLLQGQSNFVFTDHMQLSREGSRNFISTYTVEVKDSISDEVNTKSNENDDEGVNGEDDEEHDTTSQEFDSGESSEAEPRDDQDIQKQGKEDSEESQDLNTPVGPKSLNDQQAADQKPFHAAVLDQDESVKFSEDHDEPSISP